MKPADSQAGRGNFFDLRRQMETCVQTNLADPHAQRALFVVNGLAALEAAAELLVVGLVLVIHRVPSVAVLTAWRRNTQHLLE